MPTVGEIEEKVVEIVCKQLHVPREKVTKETSFINDLGADSLDTVELVLGMEEAFNLTIPEEEAEKIRTVGDAVNHIAKEMGAE